MVQIFPKYCENIAKFIQMVNKQPVISTQAPLQTLQWEIHDIISKHHLCTPLETTKGYPSRQRRTYFSMNCTVFPPCYFQLEFQTIVGGLETRDTFSVLIIKAWIMNCTRAHKKHERVNRLHWTCALYFSDAWHAKVWPLSERKVKKGGFIYPCVGNNRWKRSLSGLCIHDERFIWGCAMTGKYSRWMYVRKSFSIFIHHNSSH